MNNKIIINIIKTKEKPYDFKIILDFMGFFFWKK